MKNLFTTTGQSPAFINRGSQLIEPSQRKLVVIQLNGGNDGLNTIVPYRNDIYYKNRPQLSISKNKIIDINGDVGFNVQLSKFAQLFDAGYVTVVNRVGYPNASRSHFKSMDYWNAGGNYNSGWLGRYLDHYAPDSGGLHAVEISDLLSLSLRGEHKKGVAFDDLKALYHSITNPLITQAVNLATNSRRQSNTNLDFIYNVLIGSQQMIHPAYDKFSKAPELNFFPDSPLGIQLLKVARMIISGMDTNIYYTSMGTFDTHVGQKGKHNKLLGQLSDAVYAFVTTLKKHNKLDETCILIFSEFGRRVKENASKGTDHGSGNSMFVVSSALARPGFYNSYDTLEHLVRGDLPFEIDFRQLYAAILEDWLNADSQLVLGNHYEKLAVFHAGNQPSV